MEESSDKEDSTDTSELGWRSDLISALSKQTDIVRLREICRGHEIPVECRANIWQVCLNVGDKPNPLQQWDGKLDTPDQQMIKKDCQTYAARVILDDSESVAEDIEKIITFYCKTRNERYKSQNGWVELLLPFISLRLPIGDVYNIFYAMHSKYIPRECHNEGKPFHLFRLLLQYHDPELCSFLDSMKLFPDQYAQKWFRSLFAATCDSSVVEAMWDVYLLEEDPFLVFFLALVMIINAREDVMAPDQEKSDILDIISEFPSQLAADDIEDFCSLAQYYSSKTPQSFRKQYYGQLFGIKTLNAHNVAQALCLPVSIDELLQSHKNSSDEIRYFLVDCRPAEQYNSGHLPTAFHLDANLMLQAPSDFSTTVQALFSTQKQSVAAGSAAGGEHLCFMGSGREEEDQYVNMVVANFLQKKTKYTSIAKGGYKALHDILIDDLTHGLTDHVVSSCIACSPHAATPGNQTWTDMSRKGEQSPGAGLVDKLSSAIRTSKTNVSQKFSNWMSEPRNEVRHVSSFDKVGRRYRNYNPVFTIEDEEDEEDELNESSSEDEMKHETVNMKTWFERKDVVQVISSKEVSFKTGREHKSHILITDSHMFVLREMTTKAGWASIRSRDRLKDIFKITSKKKRPDVITFTITAGEDTKRVRFIIPDSRNEIQTLKQFLVKSLGGDN
ncbi:TBC1 domain family member 23-like [Dendronephthya gigantea]|uniref:TBC1 domain family member 23-like n=1 Tax=Dendronephthya gigantea TaxID=151771 RepID=UPI00106B7059|nr:TBC1 domain family member 23-like [Dendronephthya gigantea]